MEAQPQRKILLQGIISSVQVRSNVWRYKVDNRTHSTTGYNLFIHGTIFNEDDKSIIETDIDFSVAISEIQ